jgi:hypothetical protein
MKEEKLNITNQSNLETEHGHWSTENSILILQIQFMNNYAKPKPDLVLELKTLNGLNFLMIDNIKATLMPFSQILTQIVPFV